MYVFDRRSNQSLNEDQLDRASILMIFSIYLVIYLPNPPPPPKPFFFVFFAALL